MKKTSYAVCGSLMITTAVLIRSLGNGGLEVAALLLIGILLLVGSVDLPVTTKGAAR